MAFVRIQWSTLTVQEPLVGDGSESSGPAVCGVSGYVVCRLFAAEGALIGIVFVVCCGFCGVELL